MSNDRKYRHQRKDITTSDHKNFLKWFFTDSLIVKKLPFWTLSSVFVDEQITHPLKRGGD